MVKNDFVWLASVHIGDEVALFQVDKVVVGVKNKFVFENRGRMDFIWIAIFHLPLQNVEVLVYIGSYLWSEYVWNVYQKF